MKNHHTNNATSLPPIPPKKPRIKRGVSGVVWVVMGAPASCSVFLSISVSVKGSVDERQERRERIRETRSGELHCVDPFWLTLHRARLIIIKTRTTWHVYLMAAPGEDGKLLLSLTVTCWSTTVPCGTPRGYVCVHVGVCVSVCWHYTLCVFTFLAAWKPFKFLYHVINLVLFSERGGKPLSVWNMWSGMVCCS